MAPEVETLLQEQRAVASQTTVEGPGVAVDRIIFLTRAPPHQETPVLSDLVYTLLSPPVPRSLLEAPGLINIYPLFCPQPFCPLHKVILTPEAPAPNPNPTTPPPPPLRPSLTPPCLELGPRDPRTKLMMMRSF